jgi:two-component system, NarL family, response regulator DesR
LPIRILLVERTNLLREALAAVLAAESDLAVPASIANIHEVVPVARAVQPDVAVIDIDLLAGCDFTLAQELTEALPGCSILVLADPESPNPLRTALDSHVRGFVGKDALPNRLADAIRLVAGGERVIDPTLAVAALRAPRNPLTGREREVLELMAQGLPSAEIATRLHLASGTVGNYVSTIIRKAGARNRLEAVRVAEESGWL